MCSALVGNYERVPGVAPGNESVSSDTTALLDRRKGIVSQIWDDERMPVDKLGRRAHIVMDPLSTIARMNLGKLYEQYYNSVSDELSMRLVSRMKIHAADTEQRIHADLVDLGGKDKDVQWCLGELIDYYTIMSPRMATWFKEPDFDQLKHLAHVLKNGISLYLPTDNDPEFITMVKQCEKRFKPLLDVVSYVGTSGERKFSEGRCRIGSLYFLMLEKTGDSWAAVSSGKTQHFGVLAKQTNADKYTQPAKVQPVRVWGEAEIRIVASYVGQWAVAEIFDRNNNPYTHKHMLKAIFKAPKPAAIKSIVDRNVIPYGGARPVQYFHHVSYCAGRGVTYKHV